MNDNQLLKKYAPEELYSMVMEEFDNAGFFDKVSEKEIWPDANGWYNAKTNPPKEDGWYFVFAPEYFGNNHIVGDFAFSKFNLKYKKPWGIERGSCRSDCIKYWRPIFKVPEKYEHEEI